MTWAPQIDRVFKSGHCFICDVAFGDANMRRDKTLKLFNKHFDSVRNLPISPEVEKVFKDFQKVEKARSAEADATLLAKYQDKFRLAAPRGRTSRARKPVYKCLICNFIFQTSVAAMIKHAQDHDINNYILIGRIKTGAYKGKFVPESHCYNQSTGTTSFTGHYEFCNAIFPEDVRREQDGPSKKFFCRKCDTQFFNWDENADKFSLLSRRIKNMRRHEEKCKGSKAKN